MTQPAERATFHRMRLARCPLKAAHRATKTAHRHRDDDPMLVAVERHDLLRAQRRQVKRQRVDRLGSFRAGEPSAAAATTTMRPSARCASVPL